MLLLSVLDALLVAWLARAWWLTRHPLTGLILFLAAALPYDTALVGLGSTLGIGPVLERLSAPRFLLFDLSLPLTLIVAVGLARLVGPVPGFIGDALNIMAMGVTAVLLERRRCAAERHR
jgi:hypothetical protein